MKNEKEGDMIFFCTACGKISPERTGEGGDKGWDISCYMNAISIPREAVGETDGERTIDWGKVTLPLEVHG